MKTENEVVTLFDKNARAIADGLREEGREEGRREGIENERALLRRLATRRFGPATAERLTELIVGIDDAPRLARVGECIVDCPTGDDLLAQVAHTSRAAESPAGCVEHSNRLWYKAPASRQ